MEVPSLSLYLWGCDLRLGVATSKDASDHGATIPRTGKKNMLINPSRLCCNVYVAKECAHGISIYFTGWLSYKPVVHSMHSPQKNKQKRNESWYHPRIRKKQFPIILAGVSYSNLLKIHRFSCVLEGADHHVAQVNHTTRAPLPCCFATR